ncbi:MAG: hypothetical protein PF513_03615 [Tenericutes bacterium]|jgi:DNA polymerase-3 subunit delta'|nr:hypothetical protein [Mycoplasmatota bacterium]
MSYKSWDEIALEQKVPAKLLKNHIHLNRLNHAYIFEGVKGTRKAEIAEFFSKAIMCNNKDDSENPCHECDNCKRIDSGVHPNMFIVKPDGQMIKKEQIKSLIEEFSKTSLESGPRINIIYEADKFNLSSANALLKTMEEPGEDIYQIMITENVQALLPTIKSRGEKIHFKELDRDIIKDKLQSLGIDASYANPISQYTSDISAAIEIANDGLMIELIDLVIDVYESMEDNKKSVIITFLENGGKVISEQSRAEFFLDLMIIFQKDIIQSKLKNEHLCFYNHHFLIENLAKKLDLNKAKNHLEKLLELSKRIKYNINMPLAFNQLLMVLERGYKNATQSRRNPI